AIVVGEADANVLVGGYARDLLIRRFFFSSRRRHTRSYGDWSSDVCSSDLKTPLTAIRGYAEAVQDGAIEPREAAATVAAEAARLERLVHDLLDLARMNRTDFSVHLSEIDLAEVADDAVRRYGQQADAFGVALATVSEGEAPAVADADRVLQVVSNLVENALRLTPPGGEVRIVT